MSKEILSVTLVHSFAVCHLQNESSVIVVAVVLFAVRVVGFKIVGGRMARKRHRTYTHKIF